MITKLMFSWAQIALLVALLRWMASDENTSQAAVSFF